MTTALTAARLAALAACYEEIGRKLAAAGVEEYLTGGAARPGGRDEDGAPDDLTQRLAALVGEIWPELERLLGEAEELLVPLLRPVLGDEVGPLASMLAEHRELRATAAALGPGVGERGRAEGLLRLLALLDDYWRKQKYIVLPLAREVLPGHEAGVGNSPAAGGSGEAP